MATGGFKAFEYNMLEESYTNIASVLEGRVKLLLKGITQGIIDTNSNWGYDTTHTATADSYIKIGTDTSAKTQIYAQCLINSVSGCKLLVMYNPGWVIGLSYSQSDGQFAYGNYISSSPQYRRCAGLCLSMIPGGVNETWNTDNNGNTTIIPAHGTGLIGTANCYYDQTLSQSSALTSLAYGLSCRYVLIIKDDTIVVMHQRLNNTSIDGLYAVGRIFGQLCNANDNGACSQFGAITAVSTGYDGSEYATPSNTYMAINIRESTPIAFYSTSNAYSYFVKDENTSEYIKVNQGATRITETNPFARSPDYTDANLTNKSAFGAYLIAEAITVSTSSSVAISNGNGFKGYLNTDLFRTVFYGYPYNTLFDDGKFIYVGGSLAMGWDASNNVIFRT